MAVVALLVFYLVGANVFLRTRLLRTVANRAPSSLLVDYTSAYSLFPGFVHVEGLSMRGRDGAVEWLVKVDRCDFRFGFTDLLRRRFHASRVRGDGVSVRLRMRLDSESVKPDRVAALPPIPGFSDPPLKDTGPPPAPVTDAQYKFWSIWMEDVVADHVREVWIDTVRIVGDQRVQGQWFFKPVRWLEVGPATVDVRSIDVSRGDAVLAVGVHGKMEVTFHPFDVRESEGVEIMKYISTHASLRGLLPTAAGLNSFFASAPVHFARADGAADINLVVDRGVLSPGTLLRVEAPDVEVHADLGAATGALVAELRVERDVDGSGVGRLDARMSEAVFTTKEGARVQVESLTGAADSRALYLPRPFGDTKLSIGVHDASSDATALNPWIPRASGVHVVAGHLRGDAQVTAAVDDERWSVQASVLARGLAAEREDAAMTGDVDVHFRAAIQSPTADIEGSVVLRNGAVTTRDGAHAVALFIPALRVATPHLRLGEGDPRGTVSVRLPLATSPSLPTLARLVRAPPGLMAAGSATASAHAEVALPTRFFTGRARLAARGVATRIKTKTITGDVDVTIVGRRRGRLIDLSGSAVTLSNVAGAGAAAWWARVDLREATLGLEPRLRFHAKLHGTARDAKPVAELALSEEHLPDWIASVFRMRGLSADAHVCATSSAFAVRSLVAQGDGASIKLEFASRKPVDRGALLLELGPLAAGFGLARDPNGVVLIDAENWFDREAAALDARPVCE